MFRSLSKPSKYRVEAIAELNSPEKIDQLIEIISPVAWLTLIAVYLMLAGIILWGLFGSIPTNVTGPGVLLAENGSVFNTLLPTGEGRIKKIAVSVGSVVKKNEVIAELERPELEEKLDLTQVYVRQLKQELSRITKVSEAQIASRAMEMHFQQTSLEKSIDIENNNLAEIKKILDYKEERVKKGLLALQELENTRRDYYGSQLRIEQLRLQISQLKTQEADFQEQWRRQIQEQELLIWSETLKMDNVRAELEASTYVISPVDGIVVSINAALGKIEREGASIASIASLGQGLDALIFMQPMQGQKVSPGMRALITPESIEKEEFGSLRGTVVSVSAFPETIEAILAVLHNPELAKTYVEAGSPIAIRIRIERDQHSYTKYAWSSSKGPNIKITPGMLTNAQITIREQSPFSLVIPAFKKMLGVS